MKNSENASQNDEKFIRRCIELSRESVKHHGKPFGSLIVRNNEIIAESTNGSKQDILHHAEILAMTKAREILKTDDYSDCTLYSNCEPCSMCAFVIREFKISRVVFALLSPYMGGFTKWNILQDEELSQFKTVFGEPPAVTHGICKDEAIQVFDEIAWKMCRK